MIWFLSSSSQSADKKLITLQLLLAVGTKLEHVITELVSQVAQGHLTATLSDKLFWFDNPRVVLFLIHFLLFQNAFEIAIFFWILVNSTILLGFGATLFEEDFMVSITKMKDFLY